MILVFPFVFFLFLFAQFDFFSFFFFLYTKAGKRLPWANCLLLYDKWSWESSYTYIKPCWQQRILWGSIAWVFHIDVSSIFWNNFCLCFPLCNVLRYEDEEKVSLKLRKITWSNKTLIDYTHWLRWKYAIKRTDSKDRQNGKTTELIRSLNQTW